MPPKVYVPAYPAGDFRAMPVLGGGYAALKWVTSFPGNPAKGLLTVTGVVLLSSAEDGRLVACFDAAAVTALRTGAAAVLAAETLGRPDAAERGGNRRRRQREGSGADVSRSRPVGGDLRRGRAAGGAGGSRARRGRFRKPRTGAIRRSRSDDDAGPRAGHRGGDTPARPTRQPHGRRRARQDGDRRRRARANAHLLRRLGAGEPQRRARALRGSGEAPARRRDRPRSGAGRQPPRVAAPPTRSRRSTPRASQSRILPSPLPPSSAWGSWICLRSTSS